MAHKVIDLFDRVADDYDVVLPFFDAFGRELAAVVPFAPEARVLDLGAGRGAVTAQALARGCQVTAIDAAPRMVVQLAIAHPDVRAQVMDAHRLAFADDSFDLVVSSFVVSLLDDPAQAASEVRRVLAPGGIFAFTTPGLPPGAEDPGPVPATDPLPDLFAEFAQFLSPHGGIGQAIDPPALLEAAGFVAVEAAPISVDLPVPDGETYWRWGLTHGSLAYFEDLPTDRRDEFRRRLISATDALGPLRLRRTATAWTGRKPTVT